jgi:hypothetical protein
MESRTKLDEQERRVVLNGMERNNDYVFTACKQNDKKSVYVAAVSWRGMQ